jgi:hypothetical protein
MLNRPISAYFLGGASLRASETILVGLHLGSVQAGPKVAAILSVLESCRPIGLLVIPAMNRAWLVTVGSLCSGRFEDLALLVSHGWRAGP